jgi:alanine racemase
MAWRNRVEVSYGALRNNVAAVRQRAGNRALIAVVKADAYGMGLERCSRIYHEAGADAIAVAALSEADRLRRSVPGARIILLGSPLPEERPAVVAGGYEVWVSSKEEALEFAHLGSPSQPARLHVAVDTGMGRAGCAPAAAVRLVEVVLGHPGCRLAGICSHYPEALDESFAGEQERVFAEVLAQLPPLPEETWIHLANSEGVLARPSGPCNAVRSGLLLTGAMAEEGLEPALRWVSSITLVKELPAGHSVSYNRTVVLERDSTVALIPVGYADGYPLRCSGQGEVLIQGHRCPILGRVTMDYLIVDCGALPRLPRPGDPVVLLGDQDGAVITVSELAERADTIPYDILCGLRGRCEIVGVP